MRRMLALSAILLSACAPSHGSSAAPAPDQTIRIPTSGGGTATSLTIASSTSATSRNFSATAERIWNALPAVFDSLGVPVTDRNAATHTMGTTSFKVRHRLAGVPLSRYLDCGSTQGAQSADSYEILLSISTSVQQGSRESTAISATVDALGRPVFVSSEYIHCGSKGGIEKRFFELLDAELHR